MTEVIITQEEIEIVNRVAGKFLRKMCWSHSWELDDIQQELFCFWIETKQRGWTRPECWQGAMGRCLNLHLTDLIKQACAQKRRVEALSLDQMLSEGHDFAQSDPKDFQSDFFGLLNQCERAICQLLVEGKNKLEIATLLNRSKAFINRRLCHVRTLAEEFSKT